MLPASDKVSVISVNKVSLRHFVREDDHMTRVASSLVQLTTDNSISDSPAAQLIQQQQ